MPLTALQNAFVLEWSVDHNATQAAIRAGASPKSASVTASRWLANANVQRAIATKEQRVVTRLEVTAADIARVAWQIALDAENQTGARVAALALLARRHPEFSEKHDINANVRLQALSVVANMTEEQLLALAGEPITTSSETGDNGHELRNSSSAQSLALHNGEA